MMLYQDDLNRLAAFMLKEHGQRALEYADCAMIQLQKSGQNARAEAWKAVRHAVMDMLEGRLTRGGHAIH